MDVRQHIRLALSKNKLKISKLVGECCQEHKNPGTPESGGMTRVLLPLPFLKVNGGGCAFS